MIYSILFVSFIAALTIVTVIATMSAIAERNILAACAILLVYIFAINIVSQIFVMDDG